MTVAEGASVLSVAGRTPSVPPSAFIAAGARVIGDVRLAEGASVWYNAVVRGDSDSITLGPGSNLQDNVSVHVDEGHPVVIGANVSVGHNAVVHGCTVGDGSLIGMGSVILSGAVIGSGCLVAGGAVVLEGTVVPDGSLVAGVPAKVRRELSDEERAKLLRNAEIYRAHLATHADAEPVPPREDVEVAEADNGGADGNRTRIISLED
jgi:carbonic anhydrase/acetyltransferase-like protein (isoleucine patch superfamily)